MIGSNTKPKKNELNWI